MTTKINVSVPVFGGVALGLMTAASNPWSVPDELAAELVNRGVASLVTPTLPGVNGLVALAANRPSAAAANSAAIQAAIDAGGPVRIATPGLVYVAATHLLPNDAQVSVSKSTTLKPAGAAMFNIFRNRSSAGFAYGASFVRAANVVAVTEAGHSRKVGDQVLISQLATDTSFNGLAVVMASNPAAGTWTYASTGSNGSPTGFGWIHEASLQIPAASFARTVTAQTGTISNSTSTGLPAVVTAAAHGRSANDPIVFTTTGALPTGLTAGTVYYVAARKMTVGTFCVSNFPDGPLVSTSSAGSGTHTFNYGLTTVTENGHARKPGDTAYIANLTGAGFNGAVQVLTTTASAWTYVSPGSATAPTGGPAVVCANSNILIEGGNYDGNYDGVSAPDPTMTTAYLQNCSNCEIRGLSGVKGGFRVAYGANVSDLRIRDIYSENVPVTVQVEGPWHRLVAENIRGRNTDDIFALTQTLNTGIYGYVSSPSGAGNSSTASIRNLFSRDTLSTLKIAGTAALTLGTVVVDGVYGESPMANGKLVSIVDDNSALTQGNAKAIRVKNVYGQVNQGGTKVNYNMSGRVNLFELDGFDIGGDSNYAISFSAGNLGSAVFKNITGAVNYDATAGNIGIVASTATFDQLLFDDCAVTLTGAVNFFQNQGATIGRLKFNKVDVVGPYNTTTGGSAGYLCNNNAGTIGSIDMSNVSAYGIASLYTGPATGSGTVDHRYTNVSCDAMGSVWGGGTTGRTDKISIANMDIGAAVGIFNNIFQVNGGTVRIKARNINNFQGSGWALLNYNGSSVSIDCKEIGLDLGANGGTNPSGLAPQAGDQLTNTNGTGSGVYGRTAAGAWTKIY